jgi:hypothetical protein
MATGTVTFAAPATGLQLESIEVSSPLPEVEKINVETQQDGLLEIRFHLIDVFDPEDAENITRPVLRSIIDRLAFEVDVGIGDPYLSGATLPKDASGSTLSALKTLPVRWRVLPANVVPDDNWRRDIVKLLEKSPTRPDLYSAYRFASYQSDAVARYMFLYNILLQLHNDSQKAVDDFILAEEPAVARKASPHNAGVTETVYTRLRNEVGHRRAGTSPDKTRTEIEHNLSALQKLTKTAIASVT